MEYSQELLHWLNSLLQLNVTKVEQCGTGYVLAEEPLAVKLRSSTSNTIRIDWIHTDRSLL
jgi:hypothetical protein